MHRHSILILAIAAAVKVASIGLMEVKGQTSWEATGTMPGAKGIITDLAAGNEGDILAVTYEANSTTTLQLFRSSNNGTTWEQMFVPANDVAIDREGTFWAATADGLLRSENKGTTWSKISLPDIAPTETSVPSVQISPDGFLSIRTGTGTGHYFASFDKGITWRGIEITLPVSPQGGLDQGFYVHQNKDFYYVGTSDINRYTFNTTTNQYQFDRKLNLGIASVGIQSYLITGTSESNLLFSCSYDASDEQVERISKSTDLGNTWITVREAPFINFPQTRAILATDGRVMLATRTMGTFLSTDNGTTWSKSNAGLPNKAVITTGCQNGSDGIFIAVDGIDGPQVFRNTLTSGVKDSDRADQELSLRTWPNPSGHSTIRYSLPSADRISLTIYDPLGKPVKTLLDNDPQAHGTHSVFWDGSDKLGQPLAHGVYLVVMRTYTGNIVSATTIVTR